jgi:hypothetical protein
MNRIWFEQCIQVHFGGREPAELEGLLSHPELGKFIQSPSDEPCYLVSSKLKVSAKRVFVEDIQCSLTLTCDTEAIELEENIRLRVF